MRNGLAIALLSLAAYAQEPTVYRLNFALHETEGGKTTSTRNFSMTVTPREFQKVNIDTRLPVPTSPGSSQFTYINVAVNVRAKILESGSQLLLNAELDFNGLGAERESGPAPRIEELKATIDTAIPLDKATRVISLDDPVSPKHYEVEVTAGKVK